MKKQTLLTKAIDGRKVLCYVYGQYSPSHANSNLYKAITSFGFTSDDIGAKIDVAIGARRQRATEGFKMAVVLL